MLWLREFLLCVEGLRLMEKKGSRGGGECRLLGVVHDGTKGVCDDRDEHVDEPVIQHNQAHDEVEARDEEVGVHHVVHHHGPRVGFRFGHQSVSLMRNKGAHQRR